MAKIREQLPLFNIAVADNNNSDNLDGNNEVRPETYKGIYAMHKYWSKKPANLIASYIEKYSNSRDIVLDPFCGSGVSVVESVRMGRRSCSSESERFAQIVARYEKLRRVHAAG